MNKELIEKCQAIVDKSLPLVSNLSNLSSLIYTEIKNTCWAGFYLCDTEKKVMYLGPFQGPIACTLIPFDKGVCGACVTSKDAILVPDVHKFPGHIACYSLTNSEVVVPIIKDDLVYGVIDLDSTQFNNYTEDDVLTLQKIAEIILEII